MKKKSILCVLEKINFIDNDKTVHWVGHSELRSLDIDETFKRAQKYDKNQASVTRNTE